MASTVKGLSAFKMRLNKLGADALNEAQNALEISAETIRTNVVNDIRQQGAAGVGSPPATPTEMRPISVAGAPMRGGPSMSAARSRGHIPSEPYHPPNADTGRLMGSYITTWAGNRRTIYIGSPLAYAAYLEHGTSRMRPRPHLIPRYREELPKLSARIQQRLRNLERKL